MTLARHTARTLLAAAGFALLAGAAAAQPPAAPKKDSAAISKVTYYRDEIPRGGIPKEELKEARENFAKFAKYYAEVVAHPSLYKTPQEFKLDPPGTVHLTLDGPNGILYEISRFMLEATPGGGKVGPDQAAYIREYGAAFDAALKEVIEKNPDPIVKVNAARVLAHVCRGGSPAHYPTLTALVGNANTRTEVKYYLLHGAANLLAAYDANWPKSRVHVGQMEDAKPVAALVKAVADCVTTPAQLVAGLPNNKAEGASDDQLAVLGMVRRQAVKALAQFRFVTIADAEGKPLYPAHTLARVALGDPALGPAPGPAEAAEAVIGICNMAPVELRNNKTFPVKYNADAALEAIAAGLVTFASPRAADAFDRRLPWRSYALRLAEALYNWRPLFDPDVDPSNPKAANAKLVPPAVEEFFKAVVPAVLAPMDRVDASGKPDIGAKVDLEGLRTRLNAIRANPNRSTTLFPGVPETAVDFAPAKK